MQNFDLSPSNFLQLTSPTGGTIAGNGYLVGALFVVATGVSVAGQPFACVYRGVVDLAKAAGAWTEGALLYWDNTAKNVTTTSTANIRIGAAAQAQASGDTVGRVALSGVPAVAGVA